MLQFILLLSFTAQSSFLRPETSASRARIIGFVVPSIHLLFFFSRDFTHGKKPREIICPREAREPIKSYTTRQSISCPLAGLSGPKVVHFKGTLYINKKSSAPRAAYRSNASFDKTRISGPMIGFTTSLSERGNPPTPERP